MQNERAKRNGAPNGKDGSGAAFSAAEIFAIIGFQNDVRQATICGSGCFDRQNGVWQGRIPPKSSPFKTDLDWPKKDSGRDVPPLKKENE